MRVDDIVVCRFEGTGRVWPKGQHVRAGRILKPAPAGGWLVHIWRPIQERIYGEWVEREVITCTDDEITVVAALKESARS